MLREKIVKKMEFEEFLIFELSYRGHKNGISNSCINNYNIVRSESDQSQSTNNRLRQLFIKNRFIIYKLFFIHIIFKHKSF